MKASNLKSFALGFGIAVSTLGLYALAATLTTFKAGDVVSAQLINDNFTALNTTKQDRVAGTCAAGSSIRVIAADGTVTCQTDNGGAGSPFQFGATLNGTDATKDGLTVSHSAGFAILGREKIGVQGSTAGTGVNSVGVLAAAGSGAIALRADAFGTGVAGEFNGKVALNGNVELKGNLSKKFSSGSATFSQATPIAYGSVNENGTLAGGTPNVTTSKNTSGSYNIVIDGETYAFGTHMVTTTAISGGSIRTAAVRDGTGGGFNVLTYDSSASQIDTKFHFVVYKP
jgi:hypothetical protein